MRWEDERWVKAYTRDTADWMLLSWRAQGLFMLLLRKVDRAGILELGRAGKRGVCAHVGGPAVWLEIEPALDELLADGCVEVVGDRLVIRNFLEAQEAPTSNKEKKRRKREADLALARHRHGAVEVSPGAETAPDGTARHRTAPLDGDVEGEEDKTIRDHDLERVAAVAVSDEDPPPLPTEPPPDPDGPLLRAFRDRLMAGMAITHLPVASDASEVPLVRAELEGELQRLGVDRAAAVALQAALNCKARKQRWPNVLKYFLSVLVDVGRQPRPGSRPDAYLTPAESNERTAFEQLMRSLSPEMHQAYWDERELLVQVHAGSESAVYSALAALDEKYRAVTKPRRSA